MNLRILPLIAMIYSGLSWAIDPSLVCLQQAYPGAFKIKEDENTIVWNDGEEMIFDDGLQKNEEELLTNPSLKDMFIQDYNLAMEQDISISPHTDPGRIRHERFFKKLYGTTAASVNAQLTSVAWPFPQTSLRVHSRWGMAQGLTAVARELSLLLYQQGHILSLLQNIGGTFNWRVIAGSDRLSVHSFGIAIDLNTSWSNYWRWDDVYVYRNRIPREVVEIFERHRFIWGGRWLHYDTMHFEFRPELFCQKS